MGIFDEAIREHLELKRQHGADDSELRELEDEAFGPPARPGQPSGEPVAEPPPIQALQEAPTTLETPPEPPRPAPEPAAQPSAPEPAAEAPEQVSEPAEPVPAPPEPAIEEQQAMEHSIESPPEAEITAAETEEHPPPEPPAEAAPEELSSAEAEAPTELYDFEGEYQGGDSGDAAVEEAAEAAGEDEFFSEQSLSDELDQALETAGVEGEPAPEVPEAEPTEPEELPAEEDYDFGETEPAQEGEDEEGEDVLEETPEFLQDTPEHDRLWFEQKPPKDFDFDD
jgi:hypothetical protein